MSDLISRQAAIDALSRISNMNMCAKNYIMVKDMLKAIPSARPEPRWIPCSERLPDTNGDYIVTGRKGAVNKRRFEDGQWYGGWAILAWMPLPEPWKGGDEE